MVYLCYVWLVLVDSYWGGGGIQVNILSTKKCYANDKMILKKEFLRGRICGFHVIKKG